MKKYVIAVSLWTCLAPIRSWGQMTSAQLANAFASLGNSHIYNEFVTLDRVNPKLVVLFGHGADLGIDLFSMGNGKVNAVWHLASLPKSMTVIDPGNLRVVDSEEGPVITLHGCASHLCGGKGLAGALAYFINTNHLYTAVANWDAKAGEVTMSFSADSGLVSESQQRLLRDLLHEEGY